MNVTQRDYIYGAMADSFERDPIGPDGSGRAVVVNGRGFQKWQRFNLTAELLWVTTLDGRMVGLTPWQAKVYDLARTYIDHGTVKMREMASILGCSPSTVSRALVKLMSWGLLGYIVGRGRYSGMIVFRMHKGDGLDRFRQMAKAKVKRWAEQSAERVSRLWINVAPYLPRTEKGSSDYWDDDSLVTTTKGATLKSWTPDELREAGIL